MIKKLQQLTAFVLAVFLILAVAMVPVQAEENESRLELLTRDAEWYYLDNGENLGDYWAKSADYSQWQKGASPLGFGDDFSETDPTIALATEVSYGDDENDKHMTTYFATEVEIPSLENFVGLEVYVHVDDGAVVYLNGSELFRRGIDEGVSVVYDTGAKFKPKEETFVIFLADIAGLVEGTNVITAEVHQDDGGSSDLWFEMGLVAVTEDGMEAPIDWSQTELPNPEVEVEDVTRVTLSYCGDPSTSMGFTWYTNQASVGSDLQLVELEASEEAVVTPDEATADEAAIEVDFTNAVEVKGTFQGNFSAPEFLMHKAAATDLKPGTTYAFRVGDAALDLWSETGTFTTDNKDGKFTFINVADSQAKSEEEAELSASTFAIAYNTIPNAEFMILNGDVVDTGSKEEQWGWVLDAATDTLLNLPFLAVAGNHEEDPQSFIEHFNVSPAEGSSTATGAYFSFDYENTHFIMMNSNENSPEFANFTPRQIAWLKADSKAAAERGVDWQIAVVHKGPYTTSNHATDEDIVNEENGVRPVVAPIFAELKIDLVLQGHDHIYAISKPINAEGEAVETEMITEDYNGHEANYFKSPEGVIYMIPNTAGPKVYYKNKTIEEIDAEYYDKFYRADEHSAAKYSGPEDESRPPRSIIQNFFEITVEADKINVVVYEIDRNVSDEPYIIDVMGIVK